MALPIVTHRRPADQRAPNRNVLAIVGQIFQNRPRA
jgi:hypothetical protein